MKFLRIFLPLIVVAAVMSSCKSEFEVLLEGNDADAKYEAAFDMFNRGKYAKSAQMFESLSSLTSGTERDDTVKYYWGLSNYRYKDYYTAETNFTNFLMNFPRSPFAEDARFFRIDCLYRSTLRWELDQKPSQSAISSINEYIKEYPMSPYRVVCDNMLIDLNERLDKKAFENARLYYKMEDYKAATVALRNVLKDDSENQYREDVLYYIAMASYKYASMSIEAKQKERYLVFVDDYLNFVGEYPSSAYRRELDGLYKKVQKQLGRNASVVPASLEDVVSDEAES